MQAVWENLNVLTNTNSVWSISSLTSHVGFSGQQRHSSIRPTQPGERRHSSWLL